jgi:tRNA(fMet)-specific endonuclease VapC
VSVVSVMEIAYGLNRGDRVRQLEAFEATLRTNCNVLTFDAHAALLAGQIQAALEKAGTPVNGPDMMIAATAVGARLPVVTGNVAHFDAVRKVGYPIDVWNWRL